MLSRYPQPSITSSRGLQVDSRAHSLARWKRAGYRQQTTWKPTWKAASKLTTTSFASQP